MSEQRVSEKVHEYIRENFLYAQPGAELHGSTKLLGDGVIDSMGVVEIVTFIEEEFGISVRDDEITENHLGTPDSISRFVVEKTAATGS